MARPRAALRMPPPPRGRPYYDAVRGRRMILPREGGPAVPYVAGRRGGFDPGRVLRRTGVQARELGQGVGRTAGRAATGLAERQPFDLKGFGSFLVAAAATLLGLIVLDLLLRRPDAAEKTLALAGTAIGKLVDPSDPLIRPTTTSKPTSKPGPAAVAPERRGAGGLFFPVASAAASFVDDFNAPRADTGSHGGIDIFAPHGSPVVAVESGVIDPGRFGPQRLGGNRLWVNTLSGARDYYAHLDRYAPGVFAGATVVAGQVLGYVGTTGNAAGTPPHLHFERYERGTPVNPYSLLRRLFAAAERSVTP